VDVLRSSSRFRDSKLELPNLLCRQAGANRRYLAEYRSTTGTSDPSIEKGWLFAVRLDDRRLPRFVLFHPPVKLPKLIVAGIEKLARARYPGFERVDLDAVSPALANGLMCAESRDQGLRVLTTDVVEVLGRSAGWDLECTGDWLSADKQTHAKAPRGDPSAIMAELAEFEAIAEPSSADRGPAAHRVMPGGVDNGDAGSHIHLEALDNTAQGVEERACVARLRRRDEPLQGLRAERSARLPAAGPLQAANRSAGTTGPTRDGFHVTPSARIEGGEHHEPPSAFARRGISAVPGRCHRDPGGRRGLVGRPAGGLEERRGLLGGDRQG